MKKCSFFLLAALLALSACRHDEVPPGVLGHDQMVAFLGEAYLLEGQYAVATRYAYDSVPDGLAGAYDALLDSLGFTRAQVDSSLTFYAAHAERYEAIQEEVLARLNGIQPLE